jgi:hypothetical protein
VSAFSAVSGSVPIGFGQVLTGFCQVYCNITFEIEEEGDRPASRDCVRPVFLLTIFQSGASSRRFFFFFPVPEDHSTHI